MARTTPVPLALFSLVSLLALWLSQDGPIPIPMTAWYHQEEPTCSDCLALVRRHLWRACSVVTSTPQAEFVHFRLDAFEQLRSGLPLAA